MKAKTSVIPIVVCFIASCLLLNSGQDKSQPNTSQQRASNKWGVNPGDSIDICRKKIGWEETESAMLLSRYPFSAQLSFLKPKHAIVWTDGKPGNNGWPTYMFGAFEDSSKKKLIDLIEIREGRKRPLVPGPYDKALRSIAPGMSVADVYSNLGMDKSEYFLHEAGKWRVRFYYEGLNGTQYWMEADASTGRVLTAREGTI